MFPNFIVVALAALVPLFIGFIYYNKNVLGTVWMKAGGMTEEKMNSANLVKILVISLFVSFLLAFFLFSLVVHQTDFYSIFAGDEGFLEEGSEVMNRISGFMDQYGNHFRTFKHGALHGGLVGVFVYFPMYLTNSIYEKKKFRFVLINCIYWIISLSVMGGILCQWG